jgi:NADH-quinone oxidoreductase subunit M
MIFNQLDNPENEGLTDLTRRELAVMLPLIVGIVWLGLFPGSVLRRMEPATQRFVEAAQAHRAATTAGGDGLTHPVGGTR